MGSAQEEIRTLFTFDDPSRQKEWREVNDGVMGGISEGRLRFTKDGTLEFWGSLSLENNGGFASIRSLPLPLGLLPGDVIAVRLRGDGRRYLFNLYVPGSRTAFSYRAAVETTPDKWIEIRLPVDRFRATSFGRRVDEPLEVERVHSLGFMLSDKKPGPFRLEVDWIRVTGESASR